MDPAHAALDELLKQTCRRSDSNNANDNTASEPENSQGMVKMSRRRSARKPRSTEVEFVKTASILAWFWNPTLYR
jgi:hypothetical protein